MIDGIRDIVQLPSVFLEKARCDRWRKVELGDVINVNPKRVLTRSAPAPFVPMADVSEHHRSLVTRQTREYKGGGARFRSGDTLLARITPCLENGKTAWVTGLPDGVVAHGSTEFIVMSARAGVTDPLFVYYLARSPAFRSYAINQMTGTSGRQRVPTKAVKTYEFLLPPIEEQRLVAHILGTLDDKIELNRRMHVTLEEMARALFKSWFVDFDPVHAKMDDRWRPGESLPSLPAELYSLFPNCLVDSKLGPIPDGWQVKAIDEIAAFRNGLALQKFRPNQGEDRLPVVKIAQLREGRVGKKEWASAEITPECIIEDGDVVFSWSGSLMVKLWCGGRAALNQHLFKVTSSEYPKWFYLHWTLTHLESYKRIAAGKATTMGHIKRQHLSESLCAVPSNPVLMSLSVFFENFVAKMILNQVEARSLELMRDTLLPRLMSGQMIPDKSEPVIVVV